MSDGLRSSVTDVGQAKSPRAFSGTEGHARRPPRQKKSPAKANLPLDGTVSDSVTNPTVSLRSQKDLKQRPSAPATGISPQSGSMGPAHGSKSRPVSVGRSGLPVTPAKDRAYAGPTFQTSPAPSSLPVPKFFSRSVPNVAVQPSLQARLDAEKDSEELQSSPEPVFLGAGPSQSTQQGPLDLFFNADRAEKDKDRSSSSLLSPRAPARPTPPMTEPQKRSHQAGRDLFLQELNGDRSDTPSSPIAALNHRPLLGERCASSPNVAHQPPQDDGQREAATKSLKELLFNTANAAPRQNITPPPTQPRAQNNTTSAFNSPPPFQPSSSGPSTPLYSAEQQNQYSLHYGNRNLSPLFKAARDETPPRLSGLRQEVARDNGSISASMAGMNSQFRQHRTHVDSNNFSRQYLDQHAQGARPTFPQSPFANDRPPPNSGPDSGSGVGGPPQHGVQQRAAASDSSLREGGRSRDISTMEDDLRRMLKLNV